MMMTMEYNLFICCTVIITAVYYNLHYC